MLVGPTLHLQSGLLIPCCQDEDLKLITRTFKVALTVLTAELSALTASGGQLTQARDGVTADGI